MRQLVALLFAALFSFHGAVALSASRSYTVTPVITADAYAQHDQIGGLTTLTSVPGCASCPIKLEQLSVVDKGQIKDAFDVLFFTTAVTLAADNAAFSVSDADMAAGFAGRVAVAAADFTDVGSANSYAVLKPELLVPTGTSALYMTLVCRDAGGCDWSSTSDLVIRLTYAE